MVLSKKPSKNEKCHEHLSEKHHSASVTSLGYGWLIDTHLSIIDIGLIAIELFVIIFKNPYEYSAWYFLWFQYFDQSLLSQQSCTQHPAIINF